MTFEVPSDVTMATAKFELWATIKGKIKNPRAKTMIKGSQIVIIPNGGNTFEVISSLPNVKVTGPRVIVYDVDSDILGQEITSLFNSGMIKATFPVTCKTA